MASSEQFHSDWNRFHVHCLSTKKTLKKKNYQSVEGIKQDAFALYEQVKFNDSNAIILYRDHENHEVLLNTILDPLPKGQYRDLFIKFIHPGCAMCSSSFGILDDQLLLECPTVECGEQYCQKCVQAIQGDPPKHPLTCISCRKDVHPQRQLLIEKFLIWRGMSQLYGTDILLQFQRRTTGHLSCQSILSDMEFRRIHLQSRLDTFRNNLPVQLHTDATNENLTNSVEDLCRKIENIANQMKDVDRTIEHHDIDLENLSEQHKKIIKDFDQLCDNFTFLIEQDQIGESKSDINTYNQDKEDIEKSYKMNRLFHLSTDQNVKSIDQSLLDLNCRKQWLIFNLEFIKKLSPVETSAVEALEKALDKAKKKVDKLDALMEKLNCLRGNLRAIERLTDRYISLLYDDRQTDIAGSRFIYLLETLRTETERLEVARNFPDTVQLINQWQNDYSLDDEFKPKVLDLCHTIETDLKELFAEHKAIYSVSYRIGVVGYTSVGKSALIMKLANLTQFSSMVNLERSTFAYLQFDTHFENNSPDKMKIPISFIDIAGAIDNDTSRSIGNYLELIENTDCDLYMLVFDNVFDQQNQIWYDYIEQTLGRKCLLVRSKADLLFHQFYQEKTGARFQQIFSKKCHVRSAMEKTRQHSVRTYQATLRSEQIFLTGAGQNTDDLANAPFGQFDMNKLKKYLQHSALTDMRLARVSRLAILASRTAINTCFRRSYTVSKTKYRSVAAGVSVIPFLDEIPAFFGREKLRQAFGIHDRSSLANTIRKKTNALEEYLTKYQVTIPKDLLKSGYFQYLISTDTIVTTTDTKQSSNIEPKASYFEQNKHPLAEPKTSTISPTGANVLRNGLIVAGALSRVLDDGVRIATPAASGVLRGVSIAGIVVGIVLTPIFAAWSYYHSGKRMNQHLHLLCDDLQVILVYLIIHICQQCCENNPLSVMSSADEDSSSSAND